MTLKSLSVAAIAALSTIPLFSEPSHADDCSRAISYIEVPGRGCLDLSYLTVVSKSRQGLSIAANEYLDAVDRNRSKPATSYTETIRVGQTAVSSTTTYRDDPTPEERAERKERVKETGDDLRVKAKSNAEIESLAFHRHLRALDELSGVFIPKTARHLP